VRHDHGSQYMSHHFQNEIAFLGIDSSPAFVRASEGNGCAERFIRTLKENLLWVRTFATIEELRQALLAFRETYNTTWLIERHGFLTPAQFRHQQLQTAAIAAWSSIRCPKNRRRYTTEFRKFLDEIEANVPRDLDVHLVIDNYATHKTPLIRNWLAKRPRWHVHLTPTSSSWHNQVERFFALLTERQIRRGVHRSVDALHAAIDDFIERHNADQKPFRWTKSADDILASNERFCRYNAPAEA
jgi:hypothetical protein